MVIGILQFELLVHDSSSLKDKRRVVQSVKDRLHREHLVAVAEVGGHESLNHAVLGVAALGNDGKRVGEVLDAIDAKLRTLRDGELGATSRSIIHGPAMEPAPQIDQDAKERLRRELLGLMDQPEDSP